MTDDTQKPFLPGHLMPRLLIKMQTYASMQDGSSLIPDMLDLITRLESEEGANKDLTALAEELRKDPGSTRSKSMASSYLEEHKTSQPAARTI